jgi:Zn-dependent M28 family amino/carboxypeptidase
MKKVFLFLSVLALYMACAPSEPTTLNTNQLVEDLKVISSDEMEGRRTGTPGNEKARNYLVERFTAVGATPFQGSYTHEFTFTNRRSQEEMTGVNVIAEVEGMSDSVIVITAHYDHLGKRDSLIFNGADDDASGTAALITLAEYFAKEKPNHTLVFAAFDAEEMGLQGARAFVEDSVFLDKVVLNINMDMISNNDKNELYAAGTYHYPDTKPVLESIETGDINLLFGHDTPDLGYNDWTNSSDHGAFHAKGVPFVYFGVEDHPYYHKDTDEFEVVPIEFYKKSVQVILNAILAFDAQ